MKRRLLVLVMTIGLAVSACSNNKAQDLLETAKLEELQDNHDHARQLYQEIIEKYPGSECAKQAEERLSALQENTGPDAVFVRVPVPPKGGCP